MQLQFSLVWPSLPYILGGLKVTLFYASTSLVLGVLWGFGLTAMKLAPWVGVRAFAVIYTSIFRGTPLILQLGLLYYATQGLIGYDIPIWQAGVLAFSLNSAAYVSEIIKGGIQAIDPGQKEAAFSLGIPYFYTLRDIILPQAFRNTLPALVNEAIDLLKESALVSTITETDLMRRATIVAAEQHLYFEPFLIVGAIYYLLVLLLSFFAKILERRLKLK
ncbi:MAG: amino acid ABC transporter permease [Alphaproteobacteria bacterium]